MIHVVKKITPLNEAINNFFNAFKHDILLKTNNQWKAEDLNGYTSIQWKIMKYYYLLHLMILLYLEIDRTKDLNYTWSYYSEKFDLENLSKCFSCDGISISKAYEAFGLNVNIEGVEFQEIEETLEIGNYTSYSKSSISIKDLIILGTVCINNIETNLSTEGETSDATCDDFDTVEDVGPDNDDEIIDG